MKQEPDLIELFPFKLEPAVSSSRNSVITNKLTKQQLHVERADVPVLIELLQKAYGI